MTGRRAADDGELCTCGRLATVVYQTDHGDVAHCGLHDVPQLLPDTPTYCHRCLGWGQLTDSDDQEPWEGRDDLAAQAGLVRPMTCYACGGDGKAADPL